jgi:hypothetical protein
MAGPFYGLQRSQQARMSGLSRILLKKMEVGIAGLWIATALRPGWGGALVLGSALRSPASKSAG